VSLLCILAARAVRLHSHLVLVVVVHRKGSSWCKLSYRYRIVLCLVQESAKPRIRIRRRFVVRHNWHDR
jgi:hypothetical protein